MFPGAVLCDWSLVDAGDAAGETVPVGPAASSAPAVLLIYLFIYLFQFLLFFFKQFILFFCFVGSIFLFLF